MIYTCFFCLSIRALEQEGREDHQRRFLQYNPEVQDTVIHLKVDEEQWRIARGSKRQAGGYGPHAHYLSGLRYTDAPHT